MNTDTKFIDVIDLGERLLKEFGLDDWTFELTAKKTSLGTCYHADKLIVYSSYFLHLEMEEIEDTIRHEIAHALVGPKHGHDWTWKLKAMEVGAKPERCAPPHVETQAKPNYMMECPTCGKKWYRFRMRKRNFGSKCPIDGTEVKIYKIRKK